MIHATNVRPADLSRKPTRTLHDPGCGLYVANLVNGLTARSGGGGSGGSSSPTSATSLLFSGLGIGSSSSSHASGSPVGGITSSSGATSPTSCAAPGSVSSNTILPAELQTQVLDASLLTLRQLSHQVTAFLNASSNQPEPEASTGAHANPYLTQSTCNPWLLEAMQKLGLILNELRTGALGSKQYYKLYVEVFDVLQTFHEHLMEHFSPERERENGGSESMGDLTPLYDLYEIVQYMGPLLPRLYLMITIGSAILHLRTVLASTPGRDPDALGSVGSSDMSISSKDLMMDLLDMSRGVQHPIRGLFLRHYLSTMLKDHFLCESIGSGGHGERDRLSGCRLTRVEVVQMILDNFVEMNKLWVRYSYLGASREREARELERRDLRLLVGTNLVRLSQVIDRMGETGGDTDAAASPAVHDSGTEFYAVRVLPVIVEELVACRDVIAQEYLLEIILQVFPDDYHLRTLGTLLETISKLQPGVHYKTLYSVLLDRFLSYLTTPTEGPETVAAEGGPGRGAGIGAATEEKAKIGLELFQVFLRQFKRLLQPGQGYAGAAGSPGSASPHGSPQLSASLSSPPASSGTAVPPASLSLQEMLALCLSLAKLLLLVAQMPHPSSGSLRDVTQKGTDTKADPKGYQQTAVLKGLRQLVLFVDRVLEAYLAGQAVDVALPLAYRTLTALLSLPLAFTRVRSSLSQDMDGGEGDASVDPSESAYASSQGGAEELSIAFRLQFLLFDEMPLLMTKYVSTTGRRAFALRLLDWFLHVMPTMAASPGPPSLYDHLADIASTRPASTGATTAVSPTVNVANTDGTATHDVVMVLMEWFSVLVVPEPNILVTAYYERLLAAGHPSTRAGANSEYHGLDDREDAVAAKVRFSRRTGTLSPPPVRPADTDTDIGLHMRRSSQSKTASQGSLYVAAPGQGAKKGTYPWMKKGFLPSRRASSSSTAPSTGAAARAAAAPRGLGSIPFSYSRDRSAMSHPLGESPYIWRPEDMSELAEEQHLFARFLLLLLLPSKNSGGTSSTVSERIRLVDDMALVLVKGGSLRMRFTFLPLLAVCYQLIRSVCVPSSPSSSSSPSQQASLWLSVLMPCYELAGRLLRTLELKQQDELLDSPLLFGYGHGHGGGNGLAGLLTEAEPTSLRLAMSGYRHVGTTLSLWEASIYCPALFLSSPPPQSPLPMPSLGPLANLNYFSPLYLHELAFRCWLDLALSLAHSIHLHGHPLAGHANNPGPTNSGSSREVFLNWIKALSLDGHTASFSLFSYSDLFQATDASASPAHEDPVWICILNATLIYEERLADVYAQASALSYLTRLLPSLFALYNEPASLQALKKELGPRLKSYAIRLVKKQYTLKYLIQWILFFHTKIPSLSTSSPSPFVASTTTTQATGPAVSATGATDAYVIDEDTFTIAKRCVILADSFKDRSLAVLLLLDLVSVFLSSAFQSPARLAPASPVGSVMGAELKSFLNGILDLVGSLLTTLKDEWQVTDLGRQYLQQPSHGGRRSASPPALLSSLKSQLHPHYNPSSSSLSASPAQLAEDTPTDEVMESLLVYVKHLEWLVGRASVLRNTLNDKPASTNGWALNAWTVHELTAPPEQVQTHVDGGAPFLQPAAWPGATEKSASCQSPASSLSQAPPNPSPLRASLTDSSPQELLQAPVLSRPPPTETEPLPEPEPELALELDAASIPEALSAVRLVGNTQMSRLELSGVDFVDPAQLAFSGQPVPDDLH